MTLSKIGFPVVLILRIPWGKVFEFCGHLDIVAMYLAEFVLPFFGDMKLLASAVVLACLSANQHLLFE